MRNEIVSQDLEEIISEGLAWEKLFGATIVVTGASGILPSYMVETLLYLNEVRNANIKVVGIIRNIAKAERRFSHYAGRADLVLIKHDIVQPFEYSGEVDYVIHAAGQASPKFYGGDPVGTLEGHVLGTRNFLQFAAEKAVKCFLYFSSCAVYEAIDSMKVRACYPLGKLVGENFCRVYNEQYGVPIEILRIAHTYGPMMPLDDGRVFADFVSNVLRGEDIELNSDGKAVRPMLYISDAVRAYFRILLSGEKCGVYNVASEEYITILDLAQLLIGLYPERGLKIKFGKEKKAGYIAAENTGEKRIEIDKLKGIGWQQRYSIREGFARTIASFE